MFGTTFTTATAITSTRNEKKNHLRKVQRKGGLAISANEDDLCSISICCFRNESHRANITICVSCTL